MMILISQRATFLWPAILLSLSLLCAPNLIADDTPVEIGLIVAKSGKAKDYGHSAERGAQLAVNEINASGGVLKRPLRMVVIDNKSTALNSKKAANIAVRRNVAGVIGAVWSTHSLAVAPVLQEHGIPMISPGSTAPEVTRIGRFIFRTCYTDDFQGKLMADFAYRSAGKRRAAILTNISETYSKILARYFSASFDANGGQVVFEEGYKGNATDYRNILLPLTTLKPDVIFIPGYSQDSGLIIRQARKMSIDASFMGGDAWETAVAEFAGAALEGSFFSTFWHPNLPNKRNRAFVKQFKAAYGESNISAYAPLAYDAVWLLANAIHRSKSADPGQIRRALAKTRGYQGVTGRYTFNAEGNPIRKGASILQYRNDRWVFFKAYEPD